MLYYNNWYDICETMDDKYDTLKSIVIPNISSILDDEYNIIEIINSINDYCEDEHYNMKFIDFCKICYIHEPQCICE